MNELPRDVEKALNARGVYFRELGLGRFIIEDRSSAPARFKGTSPLWRVDPGSIRNYFPSKQAAYAALDGDLLDFDLSAILR